MKELAANQHYLEALSISSPSEAKISLKPCSPHPKQEDLRVVQTKRREMTLKITENALIPLHMHMATKSLSTKVKRREL